MAIEIVDFRMKNGGSFHGKLLVYQRVDLLKGLLHLWLDIPVISTKKTPLMNGLNPNIKTNIN